MSFNNVIIYLFIVAQVSNLSFTCSTFLFNVSYMLAICKMGINQAYYTLKESAGGLVVKSSALLGPV